jgi:sporulation protein YlmC with PRC-barrel domain
MQVVKMSVVMPLLAGALISLSKGFSSEPLSPPVPTYIMNHQVTKMIGVMVENLDGEKLGRIRNLIIALPSGEAKYVIVASGGVLGLEARLRIVPAAAIVLDNAKRRTASLDIGVQRWKVAPPFKPRGVAELSEPKRAVQITTFYAESATRRANRNAPATLSAPERKETGLKSELRLVSEILGRRVTGANQEQLGELSDLLLDLSGRKQTFAIISALRHSRKDYTFASPLSSMKRSSTTRFTLDTSLAALSQASGFNESVWTSAESSAVYRYNLLDADNTGLNARDRTAASLTPPNQSENEGDLQIASRLRQSLMRDDALTLTAKNIKIIAINGRVTLRGPVKRPGEKETIQAKAEEIAGQGKVDNELVVERP